MKLLLIAKFVGAILAIAAAAYSLMARNASIERKRVILFLWILLPPIFSYFEYFFQASHLQADDLTRFKDLQNLAAKIWAGFVAVLTIAYVKPDGSKTP